MDAASNVTSYTCDSAGRRIQVIDALANTIHTAYDLEGRVLATWGATYPVAYDYDDFGRMIAMYTLRDPSLVISNYSSFITHTSSLDRTRWLYDETTGLLTNKVYADGHGPSYTYTPDGKLATRTWARGIVTTYSYDSLGQLTNISYSDGTPSVTFTFDRLGRQTTITDGAGTRAFTYNDALQLQSETNTQGVLQYVFDSQARPAGYDLSSGGTTSVSSVRYGYDEMGRFLRVDADVPAASLSRQTFQYAYLPGSDLIQSVLETNTGFSLTRAYEPNRNLITSITNSFGGTQLHRFDCTNDEIGRRTKRTDYDLSVVLSNLFAYNVRSELEEASMGTNSYSYRYDPIGNRRTATNNAEALAYAANALNQYSQISNQTSQVSPVFDLDGNMTGYKDWTFIWDAENRLVLASNATTVVSNSYDYMSRRVAKVVNGQAIVFTYQGWAMIREVSGTTSNSYVYGLDLSGTAQGAGTIGGILSASFGGTTSVSSAFYCYDANGNVTDLVGTNGEFLAQYQYDPYGNTISKSGALADVNPFRFSTKYLDAETGLYYYGYRFYNPEVGRWVNRDPLTEKGHKVSLGNKRPNFKMFNLKNDHGLLNAVRAEGVGGWHYYAFVFNNPVSAIDPTGKQPVNDVCCVSTDIPTVKCKCTFLAWKHKPTTPCTSQNQGAMEIVDFDAGCSGAGHSACIRAQCRNQGCKVRMTWYCEFIIEDNDGNVVDDPGLNWHGGSTILKDCGYAL